MLDFGRIGSIGVQLRDTSVGAVGLANDGALRARYGLNEEDTRKVTFGIARAAEVHFAAGATEVYPNIPRAGVLRPGDLDRFESTRFKPSDLRLEAFHPMGTARISADPRQGVCAPDGSVRGTRDLYVADASLFPTAPGVNPMMTIIAFAKQVSRGIAEGSVSSPAAGVEAAPAA
jgi:choline dehydrogenase-like flavoprotein